MPPYNNNKEKEIEKEYVEFDNDEMMMLMVAVVVVVMTEAVQLVLAASSDCCDFFYLQNASDKGLITKIVYNLGECLHKKISGREEMSGN